MSRSNPKLQNPCQMFIDYKGDKGQFFFYDKEKEMQIEVQTPIYFVVLDELSTITGYSKKHDCGIYSNEVNSTVNEILRVKTFKGGENITGKYADVRDSIVALGGKFTKSVYAMLIRQDEQPIMVNFKFRGAAFGAWLEKKFNPDNCVVGITDFVEEKNGATTYQVPVFKAFKLLPEINEQAIVFDRQLQEYLKEYKSQQPEKEIAKAETVIQPKDEWQGSANKEAIVNKAKEQEQNDELSDLPF